METTVGSRKGEAPAHDTYDLTFEPGEAVTGVRIEALTHESMIGKGPGRSSNGNAVLTWIEAAVIGADGAESPIELPKAVADYEQSNFPAAKAIDEDPKSGWAFDGNTNHADHWIAVAFDKAIAPGGGKKIRVRLRLRVNMRNILSGGSGYRFPGLPNHSVGRKIRP